MNLRRGFPLPPEKGVIIQNGDVWIPATPEKSGLVMPNNANSETPTNQRRGETWYDCVNFCSGILRNDLGFMVPHMVNPNGQGAAASYNRMQQSSTSIGQKTGLRSSSHVALEEAYCNLPQDFDLNGLKDVSGLEFNDQQVEVGRLQRFKTFDQRISATLHNFGELVPQGFNYLAEGMNMVSSTHTPPSSVTPSKNTYFRSKSAFTYPYPPVETSQMNYSQFSAKLQQDQSFFADHDIGCYNLQKTPNVETSQMSCALIGTELQQNQIFVVDRDVGAYNPQKMPNSRHSVLHGQNYDLNLSLRSEFREPPNSASPLLLGPVTPAQQKQSKNFEIIQVPISLTGETPGEEMHKNDDSALSQRTEILEREHGESLFYTLDKPTEAILTSPAEKSNSGGEIEQIDLNKTPSQKTPKRRKHRPKVVVEGKTKRTPNPAATKSNTPNGKPKRKYVRKDNKTTTPPSTEVSITDRASGAESTRKSCKRALNFDLQIGAEKESHSKEIDCQVQNNGRSKHSFNLNLDSNNAEWPQLNMPSTSAVKEGYQSSCSKEIQQTWRGNGFVHPSKVVPQESMPSGTMLAEHSIHKGHTLNLDARSLNAQNASINQVGGTDNHNLMNQCISGSTAQFVTRANSSEPNLHSRRTAMLQTASCLHDLPDINREQGSKREHGHIELRQLETTTFTNSQLRSMAGQCNNKSRLLQNTLEKGKMKIGDKFYGASSCLPSGIISIGDSLGQMGSTRSNNFPARSSAMHQSGGLTNLNSKGQSISRNSNDKPNTSNGSIAYHDLLLEFQQQHGQSQLQHHAELTAQKTSNHASELTTNSLLTSINWNPDSASQKDCKSVPTKEIIISSNPVTVKRRSVGRPKKVQPVNNLHQQQVKNSKGYEHVSKKVRGSQKEQKTSTSIEEITYHMKELHIKDNGKEIVWNEQNALVLYKADNGVIVPYEEFDPVKKKRPRPRVDLDPETNRLWNLLMGKEGSEHAETMDTGKQKWWGEERKVFRGRVDSFIARMHLVQGDRRFSKWKGSVVDSVIGVFLTQNVSDHLSSSAFMSLAAKFPLKSTVGQPCCDNGSSTPLECHEVRITFPDGTTCDQKIIKEISYNSRSITYPQSSEYKGKNVMNDSRSFLLNDQTRRIEEGIMSSQSSSESLIFQASEDIKSSSGSNSEAEDGWNFGRNVGYLNVSEQPERIAALQLHQVQFMVGSFPTTLTDHQKLESPPFRQNIGPPISSNGYSYPFMPRVPPHQCSDSSNCWTSMLMGEEGDDVLTLSGKESSSSWASTNFEVSKGKGIGLAHENIGLHVGNIHAATQNGRQQFQPQPGNHAILNKHREMQIDFSVDGSQSINAEFSDCEQGKQVTFQQDSSFQMDPTRPVQASNEQLNDNLKGAGISSVTTEKEQVHSSKKPSHTVNSTTSNARKRKAEKERAEAVDWDALRKQVQSNTGKRERTRETMDSMDYEAVRNADVRETSDTIKERGMNNMLAERMKDFLNRLVRDHGSVDLEWLRDIPPDKAKEYLLSIRGLGLKSVECVRLLTLHHLAFPVDTNVGRIAVRLGWVPLQPLPESLQLHLLELYPVLESIQKYLWPRLCKLDQETLYELHYQMITFGKVFCTKREPNCNACPMRAECRHFASAFASARLALPAPGEKQIVTSAAPINSKRSSDVIIKPMPLTSSEGTVEGRIGLTRNAEPFVEEPSTPEPPTEVLEQDIEDAFYEDPDEIPVIKLNVEEFTTNLQNIIQEKMELGEGDMSKALVALSPELASIPVPKLKHVSRLRTEHQVYELPDSHPLLKGMDRREADDPSPYLLAIWTPGETADSVQPTESTCSFKEGGGLCSRCTCFACSSAREAQAQTVRGTILIPCRTAMRGSFPLNGTYFQVNEVFADHDSSLEPIDVPRSLIWNLPRRTVFFGTSVSTIFKGLSTEGIQYCFWKGFVCVRGFDQKMRAPRPLKARLHLPASKAKQNE